MIRFSEGQHVLASAATLADEPGFERLSVDGALLALDFTGLDAAEITTAVGQIGALLAAKISKADPSVKGGLVGLSGAISRAAAKAISELPVVEEAAVAETGSHPTSTGDESISAVSTQSSVTDEETENEQPEPQPQSEQPVGRKRSR